MGSTTIEKSSISYRGWMITAQMTTETQHSCANSEFEGVDAGVWNSEFSQNSAISEKSQKQILSRVGRHRFHFFLCSAEGIPQGVRRTKNSLWKRSRASDKSGSHRSTVKSFNNLSSIGMNHYSYNTWILHPRCLYAVLETKLLLFTLNDVNSLPFSSS